MLSALLTGALLAAAAGSVPVSLASPNGAARTSLFPEHVHRSLGVPHPHHHPGRRSAAAPALGKRTTAPAGTNGTAPDCKKGDFKPFFFTQKLDHTNTEDSQTFQQQAQVVTKFYKPGGPIFMFQNDEGAAMECVEETIVLDWAKKAGGLAVNLEHRYFGLSLPFGPIDSYVPTVNMQYLTFANVLGDAEEFLRQVKANHSLPDAKVAAVGGSYGGFLMALYKQNSDAFDAVVASSAPVRSIGSNADDPFRFNWWQRISDVYTKKSPKAASHIHDAFAALDLAFVNNQTHHLQEDLGLCDPAPTNVSYIPTYNQILANTFGFASQYNYPWVSYGRSPVANPLDAMINATLSVWDPEHPLHVIRESIRVWYGAYGYSCIDPLTIGAGGVPGVETYPFSYITCHYFPLSSGDKNVNTTIWQANSIYEQAGVPSCEKTYNLTIPTQAQLWKQYHYGPTYLRESEGIIFSQGWTDPASAISVADTFRTDPQPGNLKSVRLYEESMAHHEDLFAPRDGDKAGVVQMRNLELETILQWFAEEEFQGANDPRNP